MFAGRIRIAIDLPPGKFELVAIDIDIPSGSKRPPAQRSGLPIGASGENAGGNYRPVSLTVDMAVAPDACGLFQSPVPNLPVPSSPPYHSDRASSSRRERVIATTWQDEVSNPPKITRQQLPSSSPGETLIGGQNAEFRLPPA